MTHASNVLGTVQPIEQIAPLVRAAGALFLVDAAQSAGVIPIDLRSTPIDFLAFPGHKALYGPTGTGALYVGPRSDGKIRPWREGGTGGDSSSETQPSLYPYFLEGGTPNVLGVAGLAAGLAWVQERGPENLRRHEVALLQKVVDWVEIAEGWQVAGRWDPATHAGALSLIVPGRALAPGPRLDPRRQLRHRRPARPALRAVHPSRPSARSPTARSASARDRSPPRSRSRRSSAPSRRSPRACSELVMSRADRSIRLSHALIGSTTSIRANRTGAENELTLIRPILVGSRGEFTPSTSSRLFIPIDKGHLASDLGAAAERVGERGRGPGKVRESFRRALDLLAARLAAQPRQRRVRGRVVAEGHAGRRHLGNLVPVEMDARLASEPGRIRVRLRYAAGRAGSRCPRARTARRETGAALPGEDPRSTPSQSAIMGRAIDSWRRRNQFSSLSQIKESLPTTSVVR